MKAGVDAATVGTVICGDEEDDDDDAIGGGLLPLVETANSSAICCKVGFCMKQ